MVARLSRGTTSGKYFAKRAKEDNMGGLEYLVKNSVKVTGNKMTVGWPNGDKLEELDMKDVASFEGCYAVNNGTIAFVANGDVFVTPYTKDIFNTLNSLRFVRKEFYVPLSSGEHPGRDSKKWRELLDHKRESLAREYEEDCRKYSQDHGLGELSETILGDCFRIPSSGMVTTRFGQRATTYPETNEICLDMTVTPYIGRFTVNNGIVVFVYVDGHTYLAKGPWIIKRLRAVGFSEGAMFVPLSNGEQIVDKVLREKWEKVPKR